MLFLEALVLAVLLVVLLFLYIRFGQFLARKWFFHKVNAQRCPQCGGPFHTPIRETYDEACFGPGVIALSDPAQPVEYVVTCDKCGAKTMATTFGRLVGPFRADEQTGNSA